MTACFNISQHIKPSALTIQTSRKKVVFETDDYEREVYLTKLYEWLGQPKRQHDFVGRLKQVLGSLGIQHLTYSRVDTNEHMSTVPQSFHTEYEAQNLFQYDWTHRFCRVPAFYSEIRNMALNGYSLLSQIEPSMRAANEEIYRIMRIEQKFNEYLLIPVESTIGNGCIMLALASQHVQRREFQNMMTNNIRFLQKLAQIIDEIFSCRFAKGQTPFSRFPELTPSLIQILRLKANGLTNSSIARVRNVREGTVRQQFSAAQEALGAATSHEAIKIAFQHRIVF